MAMFIRNFYSIWHQPLEVYTPRNILLNDKEISFNLMNIAEKQKEKIFSEVLPTKR